MNTVPFIELPLDKPRLFELRMGLIFAALILPMGILIPFFPVWLDGLGFSPASIALILSGQMFLRVVTTPILSTFADRRPDRAPVLICATAGALLFSLGYLLSRDYAVVMLVSLALAVAQPLHITLSDALAVTGVRRFGAEYSRMRVWGSVAYLFANVIGGMILARSGAGIMPWLYAGSLALAFVVSLSAPRFGSHGRLRDSAGGTGSGSIMRPYLILYIAAVGALQASHAFLYGFASIYWRSLEISDSLIGIFWAVGTGAEVLIFAVFPWFFSRVPAPLVIVLAGVVGVGRWLLFPVIAPLGLGVLAFLPVQALHAFSTGLLIIGLQKMIAETVPEAQTGRAQGIAYFANTLSMGLTTLASGALYQHLGARGFWAMGVVALLGTALAFAAWRIQPQRDGEGCQTREPS